MERRRGSGAPTVHSSPRAAKGPYPGPRERARAPPPLLPTARTRASPAMSAWFARTLQSAQHAAANLNVVGEPGAVRALAGAALEAAKDRVHALHARVTGRHSFEDAVRAADEPAEPSRTTLAERPRAPPSAPTPSEPSQI